MVPDVVSPPKTTAPPALVMKRAWPPELVSVNSVLPPLLVMMVAVAALLESLKMVVPA